MRPTQNLLCVCLFWNKNSQPRTVTHDHNCLEQPDGQQKNIFKIYRYRLEWIMKMNVIEILKYKYLDCILCCCNCLKEFYEYRRNFICGYFEFTTIFNYTCGINVSMYLNKLEYQHWFGYCLIFFIEMA